MPKEIKTLDVPLMTWKNMEEINVLIIFES
jgi:hypothetical protein